MQAPWNRAAKITLAASCAAAILTGCKQPAEQADNALQQQLVAANAQLDKPQDPAVVVSYFQKASAIPGTSELAKIQSQLALADANERAADALIIKIEQRQADIVDLTSMVNQQANRIQANNVQIAGLKALDPTAAQDALAKLQATAQGGSDGAPWMPSDAGGAIPSSAGVKAHAAELKDQIDKLTTQKNNLQTQRAQLLQQAEQLRGQSDAAKGKQSVDLFTQSADLTKKAADLAVSSDGIDAQIFAVQQELALAEATQKQIDAALDSLSKQSDQIKQGWADMQKVIQDRSDQNAALVNAAAPDASAPPADATATPAAPSTDASTTIAGIAAAIDKLKTDNSTSRELAENYLNDAMTALKSADTTRAQLVRNYTKDMNEPNMRESAQHEAWQGMVDVHNPSDIKLATALVDLRLARLYSDWATTTASRALAAKLLDGALSAASLTAPSTIKAGSLDDELGEAKKKAEAAFDDADQLLDDAQKAPSTGPLAKTAQAEAQAVQLVELYSHAKFSDAMGDKKGAQDYLSRSRQVRDDAIAANVPLATLPPELAPAVATGAAAAAEAHPATAGSVAPAAPTAPPATPAGPGSVFDQGNTPPAPATPAQVAPTAPAPPPQ